MTKERKTELLNNMLEYLDNQNINADDIEIYDTTTDEAYDICIDYITERVERNSHFFENMLGFTQKESVDDGVIRAYA